MQGKTYKLTNADYRTLIVLQSGECIGTRRDGGPHRFFKDRTAAERYLGETAIEWPVGRTRNSDDNWPAEVRFEGQALAQARNLSLKTYGPNLAPDPEAYTAPSQATG